MPVLANFGVSQLWKPLAFVGARVSIWSVGLRAPATRAELSSAQKARLQALAALIGVVAAALYALTAHWGPGGRVNPGDSARFQYLPIIDGTPHPTGYPTYLMLSKVFYWALPFLPVSARITLISVLCGAGAVAVSFLAVHAYTRSVASSVAAAALFGTSLTFWLSSTDAEVYALHILFYVSVVWCLVQALTREGAARARPLYAGLFLYALSFGNHLTSIALLPAVIWTALWIERKALFKPRRAGLIAAFVLVGISQYAYIYFLSHRTAAVELDHLGRDATLPQLFQYMTAREFGGRFFAYSLHEVFSERIGAFLSAARRELSLGGLLLASAGMILATLRPARRGAFVMIMLAMAGQLFVALNYRIEAGLYFTPVYLMLALKAGDCLAAVGRWWFAAVVTLLVAGLNVYENTTSSRLSEPSAPVLERVRWQSAQAAGCKQVLAAPTNYFTSKVRKYFRYSGEYSGAQPYDVLREITAIDSLCVDDHWRQKLLQEGGFYLPPHRESFSAFLQRNSKHVVLVALSVERGLSSEAQAAIEALGGRPGPLGPNGAYVAVFDKGRMVTESRNVGGRAELGLKAGEVQDGFVPRSDIQLAATAAASGARTSIKVDKRQYATARMSSSLVVLDVRHDVLAKIGADANDLKDFHVFYRAQPMTDVAGAPAAARVVEASGVAGHVADLVDGVSPMAGSRWNCRECVKLAGTGASVLLELPVGGQQGLTVYADNNDSFTVRCASDGALLGSINKVKPRGMQRRTLAFPQPCSSVILELGENDGRASIGEIEGWRRE